jgi:hypothetical protein
MERKLALALVPKKPIRGQQLKEADKIVTAQMKANETMLTQMELYLVASLMSGNKIKATQEVRNELLDVHSLLGGVAHSGFKSAGHAQVLRRKTEHILSLLDDVEQEGVL